MWAFFLDLGALGKIIFFLISLFILYKFFFGCCGCHLLFHRVPRGFFFLFFSLLELRFLSFIFSRARVLFVYSVRKGRESKRGGHIIKKP